MGKSVIILDESGKVVHLRTSAASPPGRPFRVGASMVHQEGGSSHTQCTHKEHNRICYNVWKLLLKPGLLSSVRIIR